MVLLSLRCGICGVVYNVAKSVAANGYGVVVATFAAAFPGMRGVAVVAAPT